MNSHPTPTLKTERLTLRGFRDTDRPLYAGMRADPEVVRFLPGGEALVPFADEIAESRIRSFRAGWRSGFGVWAIEETASGRFAGYAGLARLERSADVEVLYGLARAFWGRGYAREAAAAALGFGFGPAGLQRIVAFVVPDNAASVRVIEALGMRFEGTRAYGDLAVHGYALTAVEWRAAA